MFTNIAIIHIYTTYTHTNTSNINSPTHPPPHTDFSKNLLQLQIHQTPT